MILQSGDWLRFAGLSGPEGQEWAEEYRRYSAKVELGNRGLQHMREGDLQRGGEFLREFIGQVESVSDGPASLRAVLDRFRHGIEGYYFYRRGEYASAEQSMRLAHDAIARALSSADWLLLLAVDCQEFCLHRARIARNQHRLPQMQAYIAQARAMMHDRLPLCETEGGKKIWWSGFQPFFAALPPLTDEETRVANTLLNPQVRERLFDQFVRSMLRPTGNGFRSL
jgi:hypothetical protein